MIPTAVIKTWPISLMKVKTVPNPAQNRRSVNIRGFAVFELKRFRVTST